MRLVLASASRARQATLKSAGITPTVIVSDVDEDSILDAMMHEQSATHKSKEHGKKTEQLPGDTCNFSKNNGRPLKSGTANLISTDNTKELDTVDPRQAVFALARAKNEAVTQALCMGIIPLPPDPLFDDVAPGPCKQTSSQHTQEELLVLACDSMFELDGTLGGKPHTPERARINIEKFQGRSGHLWTGHYLSVLEPTNDSRQPYTCRRSGGNAAFTTVHFADMTTEDIDSYVASGEPLEVAGSFTLDGLGGAFISGIEGDPHLVIGVSLPLVRVLAGELGVPWPHLWDHRRVASC